MRRTAGRHAFASFIYREPDRNSTGAGGGRKDTRLTSGILAGRCHRSGGHRSTPGRARASPCCRADTGSAAWASPETCSRSRAWLPAAWRSVSRLRCSSAGPSAFFLSLSPSPSLKTFPLSSCLTKKKKKKKPRAELRRNDTARLALNRETVHSTRCIRTPPSRVES